MVDFATTALQNVSVHFQTSALWNTLFTQQLQEKFGILWKLQYITLFCLEKTTGNFLAILY